MLKGFKDFLMRGNVVDLAVAVVIGAAFGAVVKALVDDVVSPLIAAIFGKPDFSNVWIVDANGAKFLFGAFITAVINFVLIAAAVYFVIVAPMNRLAAMRKAGIEPEPAAPAEDILLLTEIRDLLARQGGTTPPSSTGTPPSTL
ncbi:MAG TPA: large conductance mechanosensitive channel protein MscL [Angustibacter sp.]|nr:large conductance mechanosensitive channel protein MscL [Angustibacter sp.]